MADTSPSPLDRERQEKEESPPNPQLTKAQQEAIANAPVVAVPQPPQPAEEVSEEQLAAQQAEAIANSRGRRPGAARVRKLPRALPV